MEKHKAIWLVCNEASGSNDARALADLHESLERGGLELRGESRLPANDLPSMQDLRDADVSLLVIYAGDGTTSSTVIGLFGWNGAVLPLPGGTMNLLSGRLHGAARTEEIIDRLQNGITRRVRPAILRNRDRYALTGALAGPGTTWNDVREAMRHSDIAEFATATRYAIGQSFKGTPVTCAGAPGARPEGYVAISLTPTEEGVQVSGYHAGDLVDVAGQTAALLGGDFRDGPHDFLGTPDVARIVSPSGEPMGLLLDGEPFDATDCETFEVVPCGVDLIATADAS